MHCVDFGRCVFIKIVFWHGGWYIGITRQSISYEKDDKTSYRALPMYIGI